MTKAEIRAQISAQKKALGAETLKNRSAAIVERFLSLETLKSMQVIGAYMPLPDEVDISPLFASSQKTIFIPAFDEELDSYRMAYYTPELRKGKFGISEPAEPVFAGRDDLDLILVPGIAFDSGGQRLGRGGGFYDRLLPLYDAVRVGICFDFQTVEPLPAEPHDCAVDRLITESELLEFPTYS